MTKDLTKTDNLDLYNIMMDAIDIYTNPSSRKGFQNWDKSLEIVGFDIKKHQISIWHLFKEAKKVIAEREGTLADLNIKSRAVKRNIAWTNYLQANRAADKRFWFQQVCKLDGDYITHIKQTVDGNVSVDHYSDIAQKALREQRNRLTTIETTKN